MTMEGKGDKELPEKDEVTGNKLVHERKIVNKDSKLKTGTVNGDVKSGGVGTLESKGSQLLLQEQSPEAAVCWERFLHVTSIKVLLVENDDSTRHVVTALLRNCNYEVTEAANGWQAWKILENLANQVDLVLCEVAMPCLSGIGLLCKIMRHKTRKNIPVIMMSSHDSVGLVFKCLSKGAADFLLKPVRKNELKNLWQHVWRRCLSSSGSGSGSGTQSQKSVKSKSSQRSENVSGRNDEEDNQGNGSPGNGSDDRSGTQRSLTKQAVEVDISQAVPPCDQAPERGDCPAQGIHSNAETSAHRNKHLNPSRECLEEETDDIRKGKTCITSSVRDPELEPDNAVEVPLKHLGARHKSALEIEENATGNSPPSEHHVVTAAMSRDRRELNKVADALEINDTSTDDSKHYVIELNLKRLRGLRESGISFKDDRNVLRRSEHSAFSRYNSSSNLTRTPKGVIQGSSLIEDSVETAKIEPVHDIEAHMNEKLLDARSNGVKNSLAMGCTTNIHISKPLPLRDKINSLHSSSAFISGCRNTSVQAVKVEPRDIQTADVLAPQSSHDNVVIQHHHHYHNHNHHHFHNLNQNCTSNHDDLSLKKLGMDGPHCASSNVLPGFCEGNSKHHSLNRSASGGNHGSNEQSGSSKAVNAGGSNGNSDTGRAGTSRSGGDASDSGSRNTMDPFKLVRAAALTKFRQKRKERCFKKKVRYQNRQRLAEQRLRVRGQFVRHTDQNNLSNSADG